MPNEHSIAGVTMTLGGATLDGFGFSRIDAPSPLKHAPSPLKRVVPPSNARSVAAAEVQHTPLSLTRILSLTLILAPTLTLTLDPSRGCYQLYFQTRS